ncbi:MAG: PQQ-dependent sugar dehydrogenase [Acidimicrobiales bacterium]
MKRLVPLAVLLLALTACLPHNEPDDPLAAQRAELAAQESSTTVPGDPLNTTSETPPLSTGEDPPWLDVALDLHPVVQLDQPIALAFRSGSIDLWVAQRSGIITRVGRTVSKRLVETVSVDSTPVLDLTADVSTTGENGLLNLAFSTDGRQLYVFFTDLNNDIVVSEFEMNSRGRADVESRRDLIRIPRSNTNHSGGGLAIGSDGYLYIGIGDGGGSGDPDGNGQNVATKLGSILRIDPTADGESAYTSPSGNPFPDSPETWLYGVRNPWRLSFDPLSDDLWVADVGQDSYEEVNILLGRNGGGKGVNLGWNEMEGDSPFNGGSAPANYQAPYLVYAHEGGRCSVTGGEVYRGETMPLLYGVYIFADYCSGEIFGLEFTADGPVWRTLAIKAGPQSIVAFMHNDIGELYAVDITGTIFRIQPAIAEGAADG